MNKRKRTIIPSTLLGINPNKIKNSFASSERNFVYSNFLFQSKNYLMELKFNLPKKIVKKKKKDNFFGLRIRPKTTILEVAEEKETKKERKSGYR